MRSVCFSVLLVVGFLARGVANASEIDDFRQAAGAVAELETKHGAEHVLLVFDIDNTLLAGTTDLESVQWFRWQTSLLRENPASPNLAANDFDGLLKVQGLLYAACPMRLTQPELPALFRKWKKAGITAIALTSRGYDFRDSTRRELYRNGLTFTTSPGRGFAGPFLPYDVEAPERAGLTQADVEQFKLGKPRAVSFSEGIYMTAGQHKGVMLKTLLHWLRVKPKAVVFFDDQAKHIEEMQAAFDGEVELHTFRYSREDKWANGLDQSQLRKQRVADDLRSLKALLQRINQSEPAPVD